MKCITIDDEPLALAQLNAYIEKVPFLELVKGCHTALEAFDVIASNKIDLIFIDINMPDLSGMDFVKSLTNKPLIIFTTAYSEYAIEGFKVDATDYLLKPFSYADFLKAANKALHQYELLNRKDQPAQPQPTQTTDKPADAQVQHNSLFVKADYKMVRLDLNTILYMESQNEYVRIFFENQKPIMTLISMKMLEDQLPLNQFMRVHRSYIVNLTKISAVANNRIIFGKDVYIPIGNQYKDQFNAFLEKHYLGKGDK